MNSCVRESLRAAGAQSTLEGAGPGEEPRAGGDGLAGGVDHQVVPCAGRPLMRQGGLVLVAILLVACEPSAE